MSKIRTIEDYGADGELHTFEVKKIPEVEMLAAIEKARRGWEEVARKNGWTDARAKKGGMFVCVWFYPDGFRQTSVYQPIEVKCDQVVHAGEVYTFKNGKRILK